VFVPEGLEFTITNKGDGLLEMYLIVEPVPQGFIPKKSIVVKDEKAMPLRYQGISRFTGVTMARTSSISQTASKQ